MAQKILGLDLGNDAVRGVLIDSAFRGYEVIEAGGQPVAPPEADGAPDLRVRQAAAVRALITEKQWHPELIVVAWPGTSLASHTVTLPFTDLKRIEQTVQFEVEGELPFDLAEVAWDWQPIGVHDGKTDLYVGVVKRDELAALLAALAGVGVDPRVVIPSATAYEALFGAGAIVGDATSPTTRATPETPAEIVIDIGHDRTSFCAVVNGRCEAARTFAGGTQLFARAIAKAFDADEAQALRFLETDGNVAERLADPRVADALQRGLLPVVRELRTTLRAWRARHGVGSRPIRRVLLTGPGANIHGLDQTLSPELEGAPVERIAFTGSAGGKIDVNEAGPYALALALAVRGHQGAKAPRLNLRRGDLAFTRDFQHIKGNVTRLGAYAALVLLLGIVSGWAKVFALSRHEKLLDSALCDTTQKIVGKCYTDPDLAKSVLKGKGTAAGSIPKVSAVNLFAELSTHIPADVTVRFDKMDITRDKLHLQGTTDAAESVDKIVGALKGSHCFGDAHSGGVRKRSSDSKFEFSVDASVTCETPPPAGGGRG